MFEIREREITVQVFKLADLFVLLKCMFPLRLVHRRYGPHDGLPLRNGQAGAGKTGNAAQHNHNDKHTHANKEPDGHGSVF